MTTSRERALGGRRRRAGRDRPLRRARPFRTGLRPASVAGVSLLVALQGCGEAGGGDPSLPDDSVYAQVMGRLAYIRERAEGSGSPDTLRWADSARRAVLEAFGVDAAALERYAARHGDDPRHMGAIWDHAREVLDQIGARAERSEGPVDLEPGAADPPPPDGPSEADPDGAPADPDGAGGKGR